MQLFWLKKRPHRTFGKIINMIFVLLRVILLQKNGFGKKDYLQKSLGLNILKKNHRFPKNLEIQKSKKKYDFYKRHT
jgi:hypothetical protein